MEYQQRQKADIIAAFQAAERNSSGEIRVYIEKMCPIDNVLDRAAAVFLELGMGNTAQPMSLS